VDASAMIFCHPGKKIKDIRKKISLMIYIKNIEKMKKKKKKKKP
jgi:hypothetical protein